MRTACSLIAVGVAGFVVGVLVMTGCGGRNAEAPRAQAADGGQAAMRKILFVGAWPNHSHSIYAMNPDGTGLKLLHTYSGSSALASPHWSPDGTRIVFCTDDDQTLWVMNADGTNATKLRALGQEPSW